MPGQPCKASISGILTQKKRTAPSPVLAAAPERALGLDIALVGGGLMYKESVAAPNPHGCSIADSAPDFMKNL